MSSRPPGALDEVDNRAAIGPDGTIQKPLHIGPSTHAGVTDEERSAPVGNTSEQQTLHGQGGLLNPLAPVPDHLQNAIRKDELGGDTGKSGIGALKTDYSPNHNRGNEDVGNAIIAAAAKE